MAAIRDIASQLPFGVGQIVRAIPTTGLGYQAGNAINQVSGNNFSGVVNSVFGTNQPARTSAWEGNQVLGTTDSGMEGGNRTASEGDPNKLNYNPTTQTQQQTTTNVNLKDPYANPGSGYFWDAADGWKLVGGSSQGDLDAAFNPILDVYNQAESNLRGQLPGLISEAEAQAQASRGLLDNSRMSANELLGSQQQQAYQTQQNQTAQQRQTLQELTQANRQRFGGASSAGLAASELQGREFQRNVYGVNQQANQAIQQIQQQKQVVERDYQQGLQQLEVNRQKAVNDINRTFQDKLLEINGRRGETEAAKAQARLGALTELRNQAFQIDLAERQFRQQLALQAQENSSYLDNAAAKYLSAANQGQGAVDSFSSTTPSAIPGVSQGSQRGDFGSSQYTGQIAQRPEDQYFGQISPIRRDQFSLAA